MGGDWYISEENQIVSAHHGNGYISNIGQESEDKK